MQAGTVPMSGSRRFEVVRGSQPAKQSLTQLLREAMPFTRDARVNRYRLRNLPNVLRGLVRIAIAMAVGAPTFFGVVRLRVVTANGEILNLGVASCRVVTDAGVAFIVDALHAAATIANLKYHGFGTGTTNEAAGDTALVTELTTQYATDNTRPTGSQTEGATANIYRTVGTLSPDASVAITEHGIFDQAANSGGTLLDRSKFSAINLVSGDSLQVTYDLTLTSGS